MKKLIGLGLFLFLVSMIDMSAAIAADGTAVMGPAKEIVDLMNQSVAFQKQQAKTREQFSRVHGESAGAQNRAGAVSILELKAKLRLLRQWTERMDDQKYESSDDTKGITRLIFQAPIEFSTKDVVLYTFSRKYSNHKEHLDEFAFGAVNRAHQFMGDPSSLFWESDDKEDWKKAAKYARTSVRRVGANFKEIHDKLPNPSITLTKAEENKIVCEMLSMTNSFIYSVLGKWGGSMSPTAPVLEKKSQVMILVQYMAVSIRMIGEISQRAEAAGLNANVVTNLNNAAVDLQGSHDAFFRVLDKKALEMDFDNAYTHVREVLEKTKKVLFHKAEAVLKGY